MTEAEKKSKEAASESDHEAASKRSTTTAGSIQRMQREQAVTGKISNSLVDPSSYGGNRISNTRFDSDPSGLFRLVKGIAMPLASYFDGSSSFGHELVEETIAGLKESFVVCSRSMPDYELWSLSGVFNDCEDSRSSSSYFPFYRSQSEYDPKKIVDQLINCLPNYGGCANGGEDPQYAVFAEAYLSKKAISKYGLKSYAFFVSDEPMHDQISAIMLKRIFGDVVFETIKANGFENIDENHVPTVKEAVDQMLKTTHAFYLGLGSDYTTDIYGRSALNCWTEMLGKERVIPLYGMSGKIIPYVQGVITGLTEGTISMIDVPAYLKEVGVNNSNISAITKAVLNVPVGVQAELKSKLPHPLPKAGDLFRNKEDLWPVDSSEITEPAEENHQVWT